MKNNDMKKFVYLCGPTVYDKVHIGNMRPIVTFDLILRALKYKNKDVKFIHNITDIDDKIIQKAEQENTTEKEVSETNYKFYLKMLKKYNVTTIDFKPKVTQNIVLISNFIQKLRDKNFVYDSNGSYYFKTSKLVSYGEISHNSLTELQSDNHNLEKENSFDFALWKNKIRGQKWKTNLGVGRPGWHTECAAFVNKYTKGKPLLIHGGGVDLKFPHHENENAQFRALNGVPIAKNWIHIGIINYKGQKMSKSIGNIIFADEFYNKYKSQTNASDLFRLIILSSSIKSTIDISEELIEPLIKKINQLQKVINFILLNEESFKFKINNQLVNDLINHKFANIYRYLNQNLKNFNENKDKDSAITLFNTLKFLGFQMTDTKISQSLINTYKQWKKELLEKQYQKADKLRAKLIKANLI